MPEGKEDDEFDGGDLEERLVLAEIVFHLDVELDEAVHGYTDADTLDHHYLEVSAEGTLQLQRVEGVPRRAQRQDSATPSNSSPRTV